MAPTPRSMQPEAMKLPFRLSGLFVLGVATLVRGQASAQPLSPPRLPPQRPQLWTFAELRAEAVNPTTARLSWIARAGATHYVVHRDGVALSEVPASTASPLTFVDDSLRPAQAAKYHVAAVQKPAFTKPRVVNGPLALATTTPLETTRVASVVMPPLEPPRELTVAITDAKARNVRAQWRAPQWATTVQILRDGVVIASLPGTSSSFDDAGVAPGSHTWTARALFASAPSKPSFSSVETTGLALRLRPFLIVAAGDSIVWGQGLAETNKFTSLTRDALRASLKTDVDLVSFAHSGAIVRNTAAALPAVGQQEATGFDQGRLVTPGEMPNSFPTILHQLNVQARAALNGADVDLLLIDGCINDVGVTEILNPGKTPSEVSSLALAKCGAMTDVVRRARVLFPNASIVVTGYYAIVSSQSVSAAVPGLLGKKEVLASSALGRIISNAAAFESASRTSLAGTAATVSSEAGAPGLVTFVAAPYGPENAFAAPGTWLWPIPDARNPDEVFAAREALCGSTVLPTSVGFPVWAPTSGELAAARAKCPVASMGHPNRAGAQGYAKAIIAAIQRHLPRWQDRYAQRR